MRYGTATHDSGSNEVGCGYMNAYYLAIPNLDGYGLHFHGRSERLLLWYGLHGKCVE